MGNEALVCNLPYQCYVENQKITVMIATSARKSLIAVTQIYFGSHSADSYRDIVENRIKNNYRALRSRMLFNLHVVYFHLGFNDNV